MRFGLSCLAAFALACADQTGIMVRVSSSDLAAPADVDGLRIRAHTTDTWMADRTFAITGAWPQSLLVRPAASEVLGTLVVEVTGTHGGAFVVRRVITTTFAPGRVSPLDVVLTRSCAQITCAEGVDCVDGACAGATLDAGLDASTPDTGADMGDAGTDVSTDGGPDVGTDAGPCVGRDCVVISEVAAHGATPFDEFVELYNRGAAPVDLGGCTLVYYTNAGVASPRATLASGTSIASHHFFLLGGAGYTGTVTPDVANAWSNGLADSDATISLECGGAPVDRLGYGTGATVREGNPAPAIAPADLATASYERKALPDSTPTTLAPGGRDVTTGNGYDSHDNAFDFVILASRDPASSASPAEP